MSMTWSVPQVVEQVERETGFRVVVHLGRGCSTLWWVLDPDGRYWPKHFVWDPPNKRLAEAAAVARLCHEVGHLMLYPFLPQHIADVKIAIESGSSVTHEGRRAILSDEEAAWEAGWPFAHYFGVPLPEYEAERARGLRSYRADLE